MENTTNETICNTLVQYPFGGSNSSGSIIGESRLIASIGKWVISRPSNDVGLFFDFDKNLISDIFARNSNCVAIRIFPGIDENDKMTLSLVPIDSAKIEILGVTNNLPAPFGDIGCCPTNGSSRLVIENIPNN